MIRKFDAKELSAPQIEEWERNLDKYSKQYRLGLKKSAFYLSKSDESNPRPGDPGLILARIVLPNSKDWFGGEKYVFLQTYSDKDYVSTIDVVGGLRGGWHKEIVREYLDVLANKIGRHDTRDGFMTVVIREDLEKILTNEIGRHDIRGGFMTGDRENIEFYGESEQFSNGFFIYSTPKKESFESYCVNDISAYLIRESGLFESVESEDIDKGREYVERCLNNPMRHLERNCFYFGI